MIKSEAMLNSMRSRSVHPVRPASALLLLLLLLLVVAPLLLSACSRSTVTSPVSPTATATFDLVLPLTAPIILTPSASSSTDDDPRTQALLAALPDVVDGAFSGDWEWEQGPPRTDFPPGHQAGHCSVTLLTVLSDMASASLHDGAPPDDAALAAAIGPGVVGNDNALPPATAALFVFITDLSAVAAFVPDPAQVVLEAFLTAPPCGPYMYPTFEAEVTHAPLSTPLALVGDHGRQWSTTSQSTTPALTTHSTTLVFAVGQRLVTVMTTGLPEQRVPQTLLEAVARAVAANLR